MRRDQRLIEGVTMDQIAIGTSGLHTSRIGLGTWAIGGWMWAVPTKPSPSRRYALPWNGA